MPYIGAKGEVEGFLMREEELAAILGHTELVCLDLPEGTKAWQNLWNVDAARVAP